MRLSFFAFLLFPLGIFAQGLVTNQNGGGSGGGSTTAAPNYYLGYTYNKSTFTSGDITSFAANTNSATASSGAVVTTGAATDWSAFFTIKDTIRITHVKIVVAGRMTTTQSASFQGWSIGLKGVNSVALNSHAMFYTTSSSNNGHVQFYDQNQGSWGTTWGGTTSTAVTNATNDRVILTYERISNLVHFGVYNATTNAASWDTTFSVSTTGAPMPNTAVPCIWTHGGNMKFDSIVVYKEEPTHPDIMFVGDSKGIWGQTVWQNTYPAICGYIYPSTVIAHGFGDRTQDINAGWHEVRDLLPKVVVYEGGSNDLRTGVSNTTFQANVNRFRDSCVTYGISFIALGAMYESAQDMSGQISFFNGFTNAIYVWDLSKRLGFLGGDGIHLSDAGAQWIARRIRESNLLPNPSNGREFHPNSNTPYTKY